MKEKSESMSVAFLLKGLLDLGVNHDADIKPVWFLWF